MMLNSIAQKPVSTPADRTDIEDKPFHQSDSSELEDGTVASPVFDGSGLGANALGYLVMMETLKVSKQDRASAAESVAEAFAAKRGSLAEKKAIVEERHAVESKTNSWVNVSLQDDTDEIRENDSPKGESNKNDKKEDDQPGGRSWWK